MRNKRKAQKSKEAGKQKKTEKQRSWKSIKAGKSRKAKKERSWKSRKAQFRSIGIQLPPVARRCFAWSGRGLVDFSAAGVQRT